jgi:hypothetical protein
LWVYLQKNIEYNLFTNYNFRYLVQILLSLGLGQE